MNQYILLDELRGYLKTLSEVCEQAAAEAGCAPVGDADDARSLYEALVAGEAEQQMLDEVDSWAISHAITGSLVVPTLRDGILA